MIRFQISTYEETGEIKFFGTVENSGYMNTGSAKYAIFSGSNTIKFYDYTSLVVTLEHDTGINSSSVNGILDTLYYFECESSSPKTRIYNSEDKSLYKTITLSSSAINNGGIYSPNLK